MKHTKHTVGETGRRYGWKFCGSEWEPCADLDCPEPPPDPYDFPTCQTFWGSHGCALQAGHEGEWHVCDAFDDEGPCSLHNGEVVQFFEYEAIRDGASRFNRADWECVALSDPQPSTTFR